MISKFRAGRTAGLAAASLLAVSVLAAAPAMAKTEGGANIDNTNGSTGVTDCINYGGGAENNNDDVYYCLWYSPNYAGGVWGGTTLVTDPITGNFTDNDGAVRNNAASMANPTPLCNLTTWSSPDYAGDYNWLDPNSAGNLTSTSTDDLRNNEAMIALNTGAGCGG